MPAAEPGSLALDIADILQLPDAELLRLAELAASHNAILVTSPSLVVVEGPREPLILALGVGSLVFPGKPDWLPARSLVLRRREWIDGCVVKRLGEPLVLRDAPEEVDGVAIALKGSDAAALLVNGLRDTAHVSAKTLEGEVVRAVLGGRPLLGVKDGLYVIHALDGEAHRRLSYIAPMLQGCKGGLQ